MDLTSTYCGLQLPHPFIAGPSPLSDSVAGAKKLEDAGAAAVVLRTIYEEQIENDERTIQRSLSHGNSFGEALSYFTSLDPLSFGLDEYMERIRKTKEALAIPVFASVSGLTPGGWRDYARGAEQAGADGIELDFYYVATNADETANDIENRFVETVRTVREAVRIPICPKLTAFFTSLANVARRLDEAGADGLVLLHRFYEPDIDVDRLELKSELVLSGSVELPLRLRWLAIVSAYVQCSLAVTGGVHTTTDAIKALMAGANAVQMVSVLLKEGTGLIGRFRSELGEWLERHEYESLAQMRGSMNILRTPNPQALSRSHYIHLQQSWRSE
ncbi:MAG TPA: dihydroorotate dehydrogenase-like protein [Dissulfurispiraceae bacterium]|nr:dihydroorotate dehydrogenase-like protein [Dissulfurispiraceae bacterium]